ncbi:MAG: CoA transferase [Clostridiales Family XIII bacterium]|jgi:crotonobetainyl-CoA:carnitine CoA-transferase CaiB-like acyl-CoA transferase|nr:CoA transferase [Clostridiales Family XIII bacterium]
MFDNTCLKGVRVLDITRYASGPTCTMHLAGFGADVWKAERPGSGDETRTYEPTRDGESSYFHAMNANKHSFTLNYTKPEGREIFLSLAAKVDVVVENTVAGVLERYGIAYDTLREINPALIMASISGFGQKDSPYTNKAAFDGMVQAMSGMMSVTGYPEQAGVKAGPALADIITGYFGAMGILAALYERTVSGKGQHIDAAMMDCMIASFEHFIPAYAFSGKPMHRIGNGHSAVGCTNSFDTLDGPGTVYISCSSDGIAHKIADAIGHPELKEDPRYATNGSRVEYRDFIDPIINDWTCRRTREQIAQAFDAVGIPNGPVNSIADVYHDPHVAQRGLIVKYRHAEKGTEIPLVRTPLKFSRTPVREDGPGPVLGDYNEYIYKDVLQLSSERIDDLRGKGII